jgi:hypothetical protein
MKTPQFVAGLYLKPSHREWKNRHERRNERRQFMSNGGMMGAGSRSTYSMTNALLVRGAQYLSRTPSVAGNRQKFTISTWTRRAAPAGTTQVVFSACDGTGPDTNLFEVVFNTDDTLYVGSGLTNWRITSAKYRDYGAWYHIVCAVDTTTQTLLLYVNGVQVTSFATSNAIAVNLQTAVNSAVQHRWGDLNFSTHYYFSGYLAEPIIVDGAALTPSSFGETDPVTGSWRPKRVALTGNLPVYGANIATNSQQLNGGTYSGYSTSVAFDGVDGNANNTATVWASSQATSSAVGVAYLGQDFGVAKSIGRVRLFHTSNPDGSTSSVKVQYALTAGAWVDAGTFSATTGANVFEFTAVSARYWRVLCNAALTGGSVWLIGELGFYEVTATNAYGTNGCYLGKPWNAASLGADYSGNGNTWTPTGFVSSDVVTDTPTNAFAALNPLDKATGWTLSDGNLTATSATYDQSVRSTFGIDSGGSDGWYFEAKINTLGHSHCVGLMTARASLNYPPHVLVGAWNALLSTDGTTMGICRNGAYSPGWGPATTAGQTLKIAIKAGKLWFGNASTNTWFAGGDPATAANPAATGLTDTLFPMVGTAGSGGDATLNFGQKAFVGTPPTGFKALCTANLPAPTITKPSQHMGVVTYTGTAATKVITGLGFAPDFVWIKRRSTGGHHALFDRVRGALKPLQSSSTNAEATDTLSLVSFDSDGFTLGSNGPDTVDVNYTAGATYVSWCWKAGGTAVSNTAGTITSQVSANPTAGFSVVTYTGNGVAGATVGHGLGVTPTFAIVKQRNGTEEWHVDFVPTNVRLRLNTTATGTAITRATDSVFRSHTSTSMTLGSDPATNGNTLNYVAYCFADVPGYSKAFTYTGNGSADGPFVSLGFRARWILIKRTDSAGDWSLHDTARDPSNVATRQLRPNSANDETTNGTYSIDINAVGVKIRDTANLLNASGGAYVGMAFAEYPLGGTGITPATAR